MKEKISNIIIFLVFRFVIFSLSCISSFLRAFHAYVYFVFLFVREFRLLGYKAYTTAKFYSK